MTYDIFNNFETFSFVFIRVIAILIMIPLIGGPNVHVTVKVGLALLLSMIIAPLTGLKVSLPSTDIGLALGIIKEALIGISIGFAARFVFSAIEMAGQLNGMQMGFAMANVMDPQSNRQLSVIAQFYNILAVLIFFSLHVHLVFISAIKESFVLIPPYGFVGTAGVAEGLLSMSGDIFKIGIKLAAPIMVAIFLVNIAMGVIARTIPQINIFVLGFPITILIGLFILALSIPLMVSSFNGIFVDLSQNVFGLLKVAGGG